MVADAREWLNAQSIGNAYGMAVSQGNPAVLLGFVSQVKLGVLLGLLCLLLAAACLVYPTMRGNPVMTW